MKRRVKLEDIAKVVGVSKMAVSLAMRGDRSISRETAEKVKAVAKEMGYVPNRMAQSLVKGKSNTIALLISAPLHDDYQNQIIRGAVSYAMKRGYTIFIAPVRAEIEASYIEKYKNMMVDGFLAFPSMKSDNYRVMKNDGIPFVFYTKYIQDLESDYVVCDDFKGGYMMARHLIESGHTRIGFVYDMKLKQSTEVLERIRGYRQALLESGLAYSDSSLIPFELHYHEADMNTGSILQKNPEFAATMKSDSRPTALFVCNDITASSVFIAIKQLGFKIPEDVSIGGYEGVYLGSIMDPDLTTIATPIGELGTKACQLLIDKIEGVVSSSETIHVKIQPKLIVRRSTTAKPKSPEE